MKKLIITLIITAAAAPIFAFDFNSNNLVINSEIKSEIQKTLLQEVKSEVLGNILYQNNNSGQESKPEVVTLISEKMKLALQEITRNTKMRRNIFTSSFITEQKIQKYRYSDMLRYNVPLKIYKYVVSNFDLDKIKNPNVICIHHEETMIEFRFQYLSHFVVVYYDYNYKNKPIKRGLFHI